ncbi:MAG: helix-turn-helix domain-containing protein [Neisseriaceae bacterium]|nr:helix-turn-helix domain-containing protein [Neisseriaceae bacterium]
MVVSKPEGGGFAFWFYGVYMKLSYFLKLSRLNLGLSQRDFAKKTGIAATLLSRYETGKLNPRADTLKKIALESGVPLELFFRAQEVTGAKPDQRPVASKAHKALQMQRNGLLSILENEQQLLIAGDYCQLDRQRMKKIYFPFEDFAQGFDHQQLVGYFVDDLSMEKQFKYGSLVLVDTSKRALLSGRFVCIVLAGRIVIRYVTSHTKQATTFLSTDKDDLIPSVSLSEAEFEVVGTVVWKSELMI